MSHFQRIDVPDAVIRAASAGDAQAYETIYRCCQRPVYTIIRRLTPCAAVADELLQDTFLEILRNISSYTGEGAFGGWVRAIAVNKCLTHLRSPWRRALLYFDADENAPAADALLDDAPRPDAQAEASAEVELALASLPPLTRAVVWLHDVEGYTHGEIARSLGRTTSFSKSQLARAHVRMRELLDPPSEPLSCTRASTTC